MYSDNWNYQKPTTCNLDQKLFDIKKPYKGPFRYGTILKMPIVPNHKQVKGYADLKKISLPTSFSWREIGNDQIETPRNQENCGGCWAFATVTVLGDRVALANQIKSPKPSAAWLISENYNIPEVNQNGCSGGLTYNAAKWLETNYNKLESCWPYNIITNENVISPDGQEILGPNPLNSDKLNNCCFNCCGDKIKDIYDVKFSCNPNTTIYFGKNIDNLQNNGYTPDEVNKIIEDIKSDIYFYGPVTASYLVTEDFMEYWKSIKRNPSLTDLSKNDPDIPVYKPLSINDTKTLGGHAVVITGWGVAKDGTKYWEVRNSWGTDTGDAGYCKFAISTLSSDRNDGLNWRGLDIPIIDNGNFFGGVVSFIPNKIPNLQELINKGILFKSNAGKLLQTGDKLENKLQNKPDDSPTSNKDSSDKSNLTKYLLYIGIIIIFLIFLLILIK